MTASSSATDTIAILHNEMIDNLEDHFSPKLESWNRIQNHMTTVYTTEVAMADVHSVGDLCKKLMAKEKIQYGEYDALRKCLGRINVVANRIIDKYTGLIEEERGKRKTQCLNEDDPPRKKIKEDTAQPIFSTTQPSRGPGSFTYNGNKCSAERTDESSVTKPEEAGKLRKRVNDTADARIVKTWNTAMNSIGIIRGPCYTGTGFRVGPNYVMTAYHVYMDVTKETENGTAVPKNLGSEKVSIQFQYLQQTDSGIKFRFKPYLVEGSNEMDYAILELAEKEGSVPPAITKFRKADDLQKFTLLGHPGGIQMQIDPMITPVNRQNDGGRLNKLRAAGSAEMKKHGLNCHGYEGTEDTNKIIFDCWVQHGASGSPGIVMDESGEPESTLMLIRGFPSFAFDEPYKGKIDHGYMVEQGVKMEAIANKLYNGTRAQRVLQEEIFGDAFY